MARVNWKKLKSQIPSSIKMGKYTVEIVWVDTFVDPLTMGETRFDQKQIVLKTGFSDKETVKTYLHEVSHFLSFVENANLTEAQVCSLENSLPYVLKPGNIFLET